MGIRFSQNKSVIDAAYSLVNEVTNEVITTKKINVSTTQSVTIDLNERNKVCSDLITNSNCSVNPISMACNQRFMEQFCKTDIGEIKQNMNQKVVFDDVFNNDLSTKIKQKLNDEIDNKSNMDVSGPLGIGIDTQSTLTKINSRITSRNINTAVTNVTQNYSNNQIIKIEGAIPVGGIFQEITSEIISKNIVDNVINNDMELEKLIKSLNDSYYKSRSFDIGIGVVVMLIVILLAIIIIPSSIRKSRREMAKTYEPIHVPIRRRPHRIAPIDEDERTYI